MCEIAHRCKGGPKPPTLLSALKKLCLIWIGSKRIIHPSPPSIRCGVPPIFRFTKAARGTPIFFTTAVQGDRFLFQHSFAGRPLCASPQRCEVTGVGRSVFLFHQGGTGRPFVCFTTAARDARWLVSSQRRGAPVRLFHHSGAGRPLACFTTAARGTCSFVSPLRRGAPVRLLHHSIANRGARFVCASTAARDSRVFLVYQSGAWCPGFCFTTEVGVPSSPHFSPSLDHVMGLSRCQHAWRQVRL